MKSSKIELRKRGYIDDLDISIYDKLSVDELKKLLNSDEAFERTVAVRLLNVKSSAVKILLDRLVIEKSLYTKNEILKVLEQGNENTAKIMVNYLGIIGHNQHKKVPKEVSKKKSYPLPRDVVARALGHMDSKNINVMLPVLNNGDVVQISEILDAIGFMIFYDDNLSTIYNFTIIKDTIEKYKDNDLILWKGTEVLSAFKLSDSINYLNYLKTITKNKTILKEIDRSLNILTA